MIGKNTLPVWRSGKSGKYLIYFTGELDSKNKKKKLQSENRNYFCHVFLTLKNLDLQ